MYPDTHHCLDLDRGSTSNGTKIHLWSYCGSQNQLWQSELVSKGTTDTPEDGEAAKILKKNAPYKVRSNTFHTLHYLSLTAFQIVNVKSSTVCELSDDDEVCFRLQSCYTTYLLYHFHSTVRCSKYRNLYGLIHGASERLVVGWRNIPQRDAQNVGPRSRL